MNQQVKIIRENLERSIWEIENIMHCIDDWSAEFCGSPIWKHVYHTLHSLDQWFINPEEYNEPPFHKEGLNSLDVKSEESLDKEMLFGFLEDIKKKLYTYLDGLTDEKLIEFAGSKTCSDWILKQFRHLHTHMGLIMAFLYMRTGKWAYGLGGRPIPDKFGIFSD